YFDTFERKQIHIIIFDDFTQDTPQVYRDTLQFLEVDSTFEIESFTKKNTNKKVRNIFLQHLLKYPPTKILELGKFLIPLPRYKRREILEKSKNKFKRLNTKYTPRPALDPQLRRQLQQEFAPEIERLSHLLERDLTYWSRE
ncbi:MAG: sulfotransferase family protein, partial [Microcystaceae cyanobacterium]